MALLYIFIGVLALIILALVIPVEIEVSAAIHGRVAAKARIKLLFGLVSFDARGGALRKGPGKAGRDGVPFLEKLSNASQVDGIWPRSWQLTRSLLSSVEVRRLSADLTVSLGDDYYTGMLAGLLVPLVLYLDRVFKGGISLRPAFEEEPFVDGDLLAGFRLLPLKVLMPCLFYACTPQFRSVKRIFAGGR